MFSFEEKAAYIREQLRNVGLLTNEIPLAVESVMTRNPSCVHEDTTIHDLVRLLHAKGFRHPLVVDSQRKLVGVISDRDVGRCFGPTNSSEEGILDTLTAGDIMSRDIISVSPNSRLNAAVAIMFDYGINCLPVVQDEHLVGILTATDLFMVLKILLEGNTSDVWETPAAESHSEFA